MGILQFEPVKWERKDKRDLQRSYPVTYHILVDDILFGPAHIMTDGAIPHYNDPYMIVKRGRVVDYDVFALLRSRDLEPVDGCPGQYRLNLLYDTQPVSSKTSQNSQGQPKQQDKTLPPDQRPWALSSGDVTVQEIMYEDFSEATDTPPGPLPVKNSANMAVPDPVLVDRPYAVINVGITKSIWLFQKKLTFQGSVNRTPWTLQGFQFPKETLLCRGYGFKSTSDAQYGPYWELSLSLEYRPQGFDRKIRDQGYWELVQVDGVWLQQKILDDAGQPLLADLDGTGKRLAPNGALRAVYIVRKAYPKQEFNDIV